MIENRKIQDQIWSALVLFPVGIACVLYIMLKRDFAKVHLEFSFLRFPIFVGEMLLFFCLLSLVFYWIKYPPHFKPVHLLNLIYLFWFIYKVVTGYHHWGPLAFRHAAIFYYPFFTLIGYVFFNREVFNKGVILGLLAVIVGMFMGWHYDRYWTFTLACLGIILILKIKDKLWVYIMSASLLLTIPYIFLFKTARMMFVANTVSLLFLVAAIWSLSEIKVYIKMTMAIIFLLVLSCAFYKFFVLGESGRVFVSPQKIISTFKETDEEIRVKKKDFKPYVHHVGLYNLDGFHGKDQFNNDNVNEEELQEASPVPVEWVSTNNIIFRLLIWRDMLKDWEINKPLLGVDFGKPFLSISLEVLHWAEPEWRRDGWIEPHNSFFNIFYRAGIIGIILVASLWGGLVWLIKLAFERRSWTLILLSAILLNWMVAANFLLILELPYTAIPFWTLAGMTCAYACKRTDIPEGAYEIKR